VPIINPSETTAILKRHDIHLTKRLGQHFLVDGNVLAKELEENIAQAVNKLPAECRKVFKLSLIHFPSFKKLLVHIFPNDLSSRSAARDLQSLSLYS